MNTFYATSNRGNYNPYRHGVLIGNFVEDIFGTDLQKNSVLSHKVNQSEIKISQK